MRDWGDSDVPLVSIKCLVYNHENYVSQALDGFLIQKTNFPFEVIIHDDASTDDSAKIIKEYEEKYPHIIKPIYESENQYSKQDGSLDQAIDPFLKGKYIALCEGDDYWIDENKLQMQVDVMQSNDRCTIVFCKVREVNKNGDRLKYTIPFKNDINEGIFTLEDYTYVQYKLGHWAFHTSTFFFLKELAIEYTKKSSSCFGMFPVGDMPLQLFMLLKGNGFYIDKEMSCYRVFSGGYNSMVLNRPDIKLEHCMKLVSAMNAFDSYTEYKFHENIKSWVIGQKIEIGCLNHSLKEIFRKDNFKYLSSKGLPFIFKLVLRTKFYKQYKVLGDIKRKYLGK